MILLPIYKKLVTIVLKVLCKVLKTMLMAEVS